MDQAQARARLEAAACGADHLLARYAETPCDLGSNEWLTRISEQARELVRAASDYLEIDPAPPRREQPNQREADPEKCRPPTRTQPR